MRFNYYLSLILFLTFLLWKGTDKEASAQNNTIDSLQTLLKSEKSDTNKVNHLNKLAELYISIRQYDSALSYGNRALDWAGTFSVGSLKGWSKGVASAYTNIGTVYQAQSNYPAALKNYEAALEIKKKIGDEKGVANCYNNIGIVYHSQGNYPEALTNHLKALKLREQIGDKKGLANSYHNIGVVYYSKNNYSEALKNFFAALNIDRGMDNKPGMAKTYGNIGNIYGKQSNYNDALENFFTALNIYLEIQNKQGIAVAYNNIGAIYVHQDNYSGAMRNYLLSLKIKEDIGDKRGIITSLANIGEIQIKLRNFKSAQDYLNNALQLAKEIGFKEMIKESYRVLARLDSIQANWKQAYEHHKLFITYRDSIDNEETRKKITETTMTYEFEKKEAAIKTEQDKKDLIAAADKKRQQYILTLVLCALLLVFIFAGFIFRSLRITRKQKLIIEEKSKLVEEKNKDITDSINYAKRIQDALLQEEEHISKHLPEHFILFKPKDIVSGDFYWSYEQMAGNESKMEKTSYWYLAAADCTGHGVPGAFMSMLGMAFLNEIAATNQLITPSGILDKLRGRIVKELGQSSQTSQSKDGMDISMVRFNPETKELQWAGANNPIYIVHKSPLSFEEGKPALSEVQGRFEEIKPNKQPIGYHLEMQPFINHTIKLEKGSVFYLFTDGYADQFGGEKGKKFMYNKFKELLLSIHDKPMQEQKEILNSTFENWKAKVEQIDDVCVIGVKV